MEGQANGAASRGLVTLEMNDHKALRQHKARKVGLHHVEQPPPAHEDDLLLLMHETHTPLTVVLGWAQYALSTDGNTFPREALEAIERNARREQRAVEDLLDAVRLFTGMHAVLPAHLNLWRVCRDQVKGLQRDALLAPLMLVNPPAPLPVWADARQLARAVRNVLEEALRASRDGSPCVVTGYTTSHEAVLLIRGVMPGMPAAMWRQLGYSLKHRRHVTADLGLPLMLAKGYVELHGGSITGLATDNAPERAIALHLPLHAATTKPRRLALAGV